MRPDLARARASRLPDRAEWPTKAVDLASAHRNGLKLNEQLTMAVGGVTLIPLFLLLFTGLYLFALPYLARWRGQPAA